MRVSIWFGPGATTEWKTAHGITLGTDLRTIERLNTRPFTLLGFGWDGGGSVMDYGDGDLTDYMSGSCDIRLKLSVPDGLPQATRVLLDQVQGEARFSSGHAAMQAANPRVTGMFLQPDSTLDPGRLH